MKLTEKQRFLFVMTEEELQFLQQVIIDADKTGKPLQWINIGQHIHDVISNNLGDTTK